MHMGPTALDRLPEVVSNPIQNPLLKERENILTTQVPAPDLCFPTCGIFPSAFEYSEAVIAMQKEYEQMVIAKLT